LPTRKIKKAVLSFTLLEDTYSIVKLKELPVLPAEAIKNGFYSVTITPEEISLVTKKSDFIPAAEQLSTGWRILKIMGPLDFSLTGIIADITTILKKENIPVFIISTYDTDFILIKQNYADKAVQSLCKSGYVYFIPG
jgi:uncharacterized protein